MRSVSFKTEAVLFTSRTQNEEHHPRRGQYTITFQPCIRYLGVMLNARLSFKPHVEHAAVKAAKVATTLARPMPNIGRPRQPRMKLLASVVTSILTYGIAIWDEALKIKECRRKITATGSAPSEYPALFARNLTRPCCYRGNDAHRGTGSREEAVV